VEPAVSAAAQPRWWEIDKRRAVVVALAGKDGRVMWILPITGGLVRRCEVVRLSRDDWMFGSFELRFMVDAVGEITDFRGTWIELYGWPVLTGGFLGDRCKIEARLISVRAESSPDERTPVRQGGGGEVAGPAPSSGRPS
jgi:hypothetical protein